MTLLQLRDAWLAKVDERNAIEQRLVGADGIEWLSLLKERSRVDGETLAAWFEYEKASWGEQAATLRGNN